MSNKTPSDPPSTEDLEVALRVLQSVAGTSDRFPYLPKVADAARAVLAEVESVLDFREVMVRYNPNTDICSIFQS